MKDEWVTPQWLFDLCNKYFRFELDVAANYDNRKCNLRKVNNGQNMRNSILYSSNTSGVKGTSLDKRLNKWHSYITINKHRITLGYFKDFDEAVRARKEAEEKYFGEFAYNPDLQTTPEEQEEIS